MNITKFAIRFGLALAAVVALAPASALTTMQGVAFFTPDTGFSNHTAPQKAAFFSVDLADEFAPDTITGGGYDVEDFSNFIYQLDGADVSEALQRITFYTGPLGGLFSLVFASQVLDFYGPDIGSTGFLSHGIFEATEVYDENLSGNGVALIVVGIPEPATWAMLLIGFGAIGAMLRRRRLAVA